MATDDGGEMVIAIIFACTEIPQYAIGIKTEEGYQMPWQAAGKTLRKDLNWFRGKTSPQEEDEVCALVMGWNTWLSLGQKPLPNRRHFIITQNHLQEWNHGEGNLDKAVAYPDLATAIDAAEHTGVDKLFVVGGPGLLLEAAQFYATEAYITYVHLYCDCNIPLISAKEVFVHVVGSMEKVIDFTDVEEVPGGAVALTFFHFRQKEET